MPDESTPGDSPKIRFTQSSLGGSGGSPPTPPDPAPTPAPAIDEGAAPVLGSSKIRTVGRPSETGEQWKRSPVTTGAGACHVKTFHAKLTDESLAYIDRQINEWLDEHPEFEVKFVTSTIGMFTGKSKEPALICQVWV